MGLVRARSAYCSAARVRSVRENIAVERSSRLPLARQVCPLMSDSFSRDDDDELGNDSDDQSQSVSALPPNARRTEQTSRKSTGGLTPRAAAAVNSASAPAVRSSGETRVRLGAAALNEIRRMPQARDLLVPVSTTGARDCARPQDRLGARGRRCSCAARGRRVLLGELV